MDWKDIKQAGFIDVGEQRHELSHLSDKIYNLTLPATSKHPETNFEMLVQYASHCVSWGPKKEGPPIDFDIHGHDRRIIDEKGVHRCFCDSRYPLSLKLPEIMETLPEKMCFFTGYENWLTIEIVAPQGTSEEYEIFFNVTRQSGKLLRVYVESAYVRDPAYAPLKPKKAKKSDKIRGKTLLLKKLRREAIRKPPRRGR